MCMCGEGGRGELGGTEEAGVGGGWSEGLKGKAGRGGGEGGRGESDGVEGNVCVGGGGSGGGVGVGGG